MTEYASQPMINRKASLLETPLEPVIGLAGGETRWPSMSALYFPASCLIAALIDDAASSYPSHAFVFASSAGTVRTV
jgi:hypothetical protein